MGVRKHASRFCRSGTVPQLRPDHKWQCITVKTSYIFPFEPLTTVLRYTCSLSNYLRPCFEPSSVRTSQQIWSNKSCRTFLPSFSGQSGSYALFYNHERTNQSSPCFPSSTPTGNLHTKELVYVFLRGEYSAMQQSLYTLR